VVAALALLSGLLWGASDFAGGLVARRLPAVAVVAWSQLAGLGLVTAVALGTAGFATPAGSWLGWAVVAGLSGALGLVAFYTALATGTMGVVAPIAALGAVVPVLAGLAAGERPSPLQWVGILMALGGSVLASGPELSAEATGRAVLLAALAGACFGVALLGIARGSATDPVVTLFGMRATSVAVFAALAVAVRATGGVAPGDAPALVAVGFADAGANLLFGYAAAQGLVSVVAVLGALYPVTTVLLARYVLGERMLAVQRAGVVVALLGVVALAAG
jgi:drug/metabolite transporter (DMT)-like permease